MKEIKLNPKYDAELKYEYEEHKYFVPTKERYWQEVPSVTGILKVFKDINAKGFSDLDNWFKKTGIK